MYVRLSVCLSVCLSVGMYVYMLVSIDTVIPIIIWVIPYHNQSHIRLYIGKNDANRDLTCFTAEFLCMRMLASMDERKVAPFFGKKKQPLAPKLR